MECGRRTRRRPIELDYAAAKDAEMGKAEQRAWGIEQSAKCNEKFYFRLRVKLGFGCQEVSGNTQGYEKLFSSRIKGVKPSRFI